MKSRKAANRMVPVSIFLFIVAAITFYFASSVPSAGGIIKIVGSVLWGVGVLYSIYITRSEISNALQLVKELETVGLKRLESIEMKYRDGAAKAHSESRPERRNYPKSIVGGMLQERSNRATYACAALTGFLLLYMMTNAFASIENNWIIFTLVLFLIASIWVRQVIWVYRIRHGYFGNSEHEIRELIGFILKEADRIDPGGGVRRRLVDELDFAEQERIKSRLREYGFLRTGE